MLVAALSVALLSKAVPCGADILKESRDAYAKLATYSDSGTSTWHYKEHGKKVGKSFHKFETYVEQGSKLKVIWFDFPLQGEPDIFPNSSWTVVAPGNGKFYRWTTYSQNRVEVKTGKDVLSDWGACWMTTLAPLVLSILFPDLESDSPITSASGSKVIKSEILDGRKCFVVTGVQDDLGGELALWIDCETYLIYRYRDSHEIRPAAELADCDFTEFNFKPHANPTLDKSVFRPHP